MAKFFAKVCDIGDASRGSLSSYAYILMLLHYLQQCNPPVIPVLQVRNLRLKLLFRFGRLAFLNFEISNRNLLNCTPWGLAPFKTMLSTFYFLTEFYQFFHNSKDIYITKHCLGIISRRREAGQHGGRLERLVLWQHGYAQTSLASARPEPAISCRVVDRLPWVLRGR